MDLRDYVRILGKRWMLILLIALVGVGGGATASVLTAPLYRASTLVFVSVQSSGAVNELAQGNNFTQGQVKSYAEAVSTPRVLDAVIDELGLDESAEQLALSVDASAPLDTVNIEIAVTRRSAVDAAAIANAVTASFRDVIAEITRPANGDASPVRVSVLRSATEPAKAVSPNTTLNVGFGFLAGLVIGLGIALLIEVLDTRIRTERDVRALTDAAILGGIAFDKDTVRRPLVVQAEPASARAEAFRSLRTNLQFLDVEGGPRSFVVTSALPEEGKTTTAANLAITIAQSGARVVVVDADLRRPRLAEQLGLEGAVGLSDVLIGRVALADALQQWGNLPLHVLPAGTRPPNPSELLGSQAMAMVVRTLETQFDAVLFDAPPLLPVTDGALLAKQTRGALLLVAAGRTRRDDFTSAVRAIENVDARLSGVVITMLPTKGADTYGRYGYVRYAEFESPRPARVVRAAAS
ncbi:polysaccharide biosynthesis tyrosine autokinase [Pseudolysinimonas sp.]|jgi:succinoglycan biosynthesis transport protein ExoP|uniref:polysaccharide biosynthesis tyrosine autokinase n=1 Tax=Pseudolysinimonas sp. TaxID=2680009 RepID=UPI003783408A